MQQRTEHVIKATFMHRFAPLLSFIKLDKNVKLMAIMYSYIQVGFEPTCLLESDFELGQHVTEPDTFVQNSPVRLPVEHFC